MRMQCAVTGCSNQLGEDNGYNETTFHEVPTNRKQREKWLSILDLEKGGNKLYVCSLHFNYDDFFPSGQLKPGAIPELVMACRICLTVGGRMYDLSSSALSKAYEELTGLVTWDADCIPHKLCWECARRVLSSRHLRERAMRSHHLLTEVAKYKFLTTDAILNIDRIENNLMSRLAHKITTVDEFDLIIQEDDEMQDKKMDVDEDLTFKDDIDKTFHFDVPLKEEISFSNDDERSVSSELFAEANDIFIEPELVKFEEPTFEKEKNNRPLREKNKQKKKLKTKTKEEKLKHDKRSEKIINLDDSIFEIKDLTMEEQREEIENRKQGSNFKNAQFKCLVCFKGFGEESSYTMHMYRHSDEAGQYECDLCKLRFKIRRDVNQHMRSHMQKFFCKSCPYVTMRRCAAKNHENYHNGKVYFCPHCAESFAKVSTYMSHVRIKHPSEFVCELCGYSFISQKGVMMHKSLKHRLDDHTIPPDAPICEPCDIRFQSVAALEKHRILSPKHTVSVGPMRPPRGPNRTTKRPPVHQGPITCEQCDEKLPNGVQYFQHFRRAHPDKNRTNFPSTRRARPQSMCEVCGKMFQSLALLIDHGHTHTTEKQFSCSECNKRFQRKYRLVQHLKLHQDVKKTYGCPQCGKFLSSKSNLYRHSYTHRSVKPFKCEVCEKRFKTKYQRHDHIAYVHMKKPWPKRNRDRRTTHTNLKPYKCEMCGKNFKHTSQRREHIAYVHMKKPWPKRNKADRRTVLPQQEASDEDRHQMWTCE